MHKRTVRSPPKNSPGFHTVEYCSGDIGKHETLKSRKLDGVFYQYLRVGNAASEHRFLRAFKYWNTAELVGVATAKKLEPVNFSTDIMASWAPAEILLLKNGGHL